MSGNTVATNLAEDLDRLKAGEILTDIDVMRLKFAGRLLRAGEELYFAAHADTIPGIRDALAGYVKARRGE